MGVFASKRLDLSKQAPEQRVLAPPPRISSSFVCRNAFLCLILSRISWSASCALPSSSSYSMEAELRQIKLCPLLLIEIGRVILMPRMQVRPVSYPTTQHQCLVMNCSCSSRHFIVRSCRLPRKTSTDLANLALSVAVKVIGGLAIVAILSCSSSLNGRNICEAS